MASGIGRGRGWLNINRGNVTPGNPQSNEHQSPSFPKPLHPALSQYSKLISLINQLNTEDDGILLNQKLKAITETWTADCPTSNDVEESFSYIYQKCLDDAGLAAKVVNMVSSHTFITTEIASKKIRSLFISQIQNTYENSKQLQLTNPSNFRTAVRMLGEFYNKARFINGSPISLLATPLLYYFDMLLDSSQHADLELFTTQFQVNATAIRAEHPHQLTEIINKVRKLLTTNLDISQTARLYLLLVVEMANNRCCLLPSDVLSFYQEQLGDQVMSQFQSMLGALSIQTHQTNKTLDSYQSSVNVLQITPPESSSPNTDQTATPLQNKYTGTQSYNCPNLNSNEPPLCVGTWDGQKEKSSVRDKPGRPILGAGARFNKEKNDGTSHWRDSNKDTSSSWTDKSNPNWRDKKPSSKNYNKGWEHDDRFENDYN